VSDSIEPLILDLLEWVGPDGRDYREVIEAWRTSCPRLPVWEEATSLGLLERALDRGRPVVSVTALGAEFLAERRVSSAT
jgi:hypothetical protein